MTALSASSSGSGSPAVGGLGVVVDAGTQQRLDAGDVPRLEAGDDRRDEHRVGLADAGVDDPRDPLWCRWFDPLVLTLPEQQHADVLDAPLVLRDVRGEPAGEPFSVRDAADPKARVVADLAAVVLDLPASEVIATDRDHRNLDLPREVLDRVVGQLEAAAWEAALPAEELQHRREPEPRRPRLVAQELSFAVVEREVLDDIVKADLATRRRPFDARRAHIASTYEAAISSGGLVYRAMYRCERCPSRRSSS